MWPWGGGCSSGELCSPREGGCCEGSCSKGGLCGPVEGSCVAQGKGAVPRQSCAVLWRNSKGKHLGPTSRFSQCTSGALVRGNNATLARKNNSCDINAARGGSLGRGKRVGNVAGRRPAAYYRSTVTLEVGM